MIIGNLKIKKFFNHSKTLQLSRYIKFMFEKTRIFEHKLKYIPYKTNNGHTLLYSNLYINHSQVGVHRFICGPKRSEEKNSGFIVVC